MRVVDGQAMSDLFHRKWTLVTGASSGIGEVFARRLAERKSNLILTARSADKLHALARTVEAEHGIDTRVVPVDLGAQDGATRLAIAVAALDLPVEHLVNNAGVGAVGLVVDAEAARHADMVRLNCEALVVLTRHLLPAMIARRSGGVIQVASTASFQPVPYMATYAATKAFVHSYTVALAEELRSSGVRMMALCPGPVPTGFQEAAGIPQLAGPMARIAMTADETVLAALRAYEDERTVCVPGSINRLTALSAKLLPRWLITRAAGEAMRRSGRALPAKGGTSR